MHDAGKSSATDWEKNQLDSTTQASFEMHRRAKVKKPAEHLHGGRRAGNNMQTTLWQDGQYGVRDGTRNLLKT
jgi:hypothetical protein